MPALGRVDTVQPDSPSVDFERVAVDHRRLAGHVGKRDGGQQGDQDGEGAEHGDRPGFTGASFIRKLMNGPGQHNWSLAGSSRITSNKTIIFKPSDQFILTISGPVYNSTFGY